VLTQSRSELIRRTFDAIAGSRRAIVHLYNSTSELQRRVVFGQDRAGIIDIAVTGGKPIGDLAAAVPDTEIIQQYRAPHAFQSENHVALMGRKLPQARISTTSPSTIHRSTKPWCATHVVATTRCIRESF
jgi:hypothetical protein